MKSHKISESVVRRLPVYLQYLKQLHQLGVHTVSSQQLAMRLDVNPAQIRKDFAYFGDFGRKGIGYNVENLIKNIQKILKIDQTLDVVLIGAGNLGHALANYNKYKQNNMKIVAVFDSDDLKIGTRINDMIVQSTSELQKTIEQQCIHVAVITVPDTYAQQVADELISSGIKAILNFAPTLIKAPPHVRIHHVDFTASLLSLAYYL